MFVLLVLGLFVVLKNFVQAAFQVDFIVPFSGQVIPLGTAGTFVMIVLSCTNFVPQYAELTAKKDGYFISGATFTPSISGGQTLFTTLSLGGNITGPIELSAKVKDLNSSTMVSASSTLIISTSSRMMEKPVLINGYFK